MSAHSAEKDAPNLRHRIVVAWRRFMGNHDDGTRHRWINVRWESGETHPCGWDYCHCQKQKCADCGDTRTLSDGVDECR